MNHRPDQPSPSEAAPGAHQALRASAMLGALCLVATLAAGCGQYHGVHQAAVLARAGGGGNGENQTADPLIRYTEVTIRTTRAPGASGGRSGTLAVCPVHGRGSFSDDFGAPRFSGGFHRHAGNDIFAASGTPVVAPFEGRAVETPNSLGGLAVTVYGAQGWVYNAHLVRYGKTGPVRTGDVIGFVGNTGDAAGGPTHDHFEWHPEVMPPAPHRSPYGFVSIGNAVDPYPSLVQACTG